MALAGELAKYIGNELVKTGGKSALSSLVPSVASKVGTELATKAGTNMLTKAGTATLGNLVPKVATTSASPDMITLYRGLTQKYDPKYPVAKLDTSGYESWTDNLDLARQYGDNVYSIEVPKADIKTSYLDENPKSPTYGDRNPIYSIDKKAGLNGVSGNEYLLEVGSPYQKGLIYNEVPSELETAVRNSGVSSDVAKRADGYLGGRMLDKNGKPMTFYHSTPNEFSKFDDARLGENTGYDNTALGHFVTTDKDFSKRFIDIDNVGKTGRTMELQAKIQKPITHPYMAGQKYDEKELDKIVEDYLIATDNQAGLESLRELAEEDGTSLYDTYMDLTFGGDSPFEYSADDRKALLDNGYDAVEIVEGPKSGLVEGSKDDSIVSSYAVLNGDNLIPVRHIPVQQDNYIPLYHQTSANSLADFSLDKRSAGMSDATMPEGIFLKETDADIGLPGKNQLQLDARLNNPLKVMNRDDLKAKLMAMNPKVAKYLRAETDLDNYYEKLSEEAQDAVDKAYEKMYYDKSDANKKAFEEATENMKGIIPEWREKIRENAATSQKEIKKLLKENGYDGMIMDEDRGSFGRKVKSYLVLDKEQLRDNSVPVKFNKSSSSNLEPATKLGKDLNSVAKAMREYKAKNVKKMADNMIDGYSNEIFDWAALRKKGEKAIEEMVGKEGLKNLKTFVEPVVNNTAKAGEYELNKKIATKFLEGSDSDWIVEYSRELLPPGTKIYRRGSKSGISWTTDEALAKSSKYDGELLEHILTEDDRYIAPQFIDILQRTIENENQVLFKLK